MLLSLPIVKSRFVPTQMITVSVYCFMFQYKKNLESEGTDQGHRNSADLVSEVQRIFYKVNVTSTLGRHLAACVGCAGLLSGPILVLTQRL